MLKKTGGRWCNTMTLALLLSLGAGAASAQALDLGGIADGLTAQVSRIGVLIEVVSYVLGVALGIAGLMKFRAHSQNPNDPSNKMSTAFMLVFVGAALVAIPAVLGSGISTIFGEGAATTNGKSGFGLVVN
ncbi:hypothetical protein [Defluviimonas salinarum]|uniref:TrbC/VIRB2 family protein n=1 Tax=Defluviimonas salinarum TaxID=2992147 RepID=A0ABT3J4K6_9RHOB|nr:hypothetical protein [Defluviimonas salinarum]MCW3782608.1 hypothetical protein [Defluviimonas salinarum]